MLNRHAIVLFLGLAALTLVRPVAPAGPLFAAFLVLVVGLLLDRGVIEGLRSLVAHVLQATGVVLLLYEAVRLLRGSPHLSLAEAGIAVAVLGTLLEMRSGFERLRMAVLVQSAGDVLFLAGCAVAAITATQRPSTIGWVFIALSGGLGLYAAITNLVLQISRLRNPQAGWRYRVLAVEPEGLRLKTPGAEAQIGWPHVEAVRRLDAKHLVLVLPSPLPPEVKAAGLPLEELREAPEAVIPELAPPPERYGFVLHEQELGRPLGEAESLLRQFVPA